MCEPCGGVSSEIARPGRGIRQAATELEKMKCFTPAATDRSSTWRSPMTFVRQYSGSSLPVKS